MKKLLKYKIIVLIAFLFVAGISEAQQNQIIKRWVKGTVVATDIKADPNTIVVNTINWKGQELTVGAQVSSRTVITINGEPASLKKIAVGDKVSMIYLREPTRLVAQQIDVSR